MNKVFLPLRSNSAWFVGQDFRNRFERKLKNFLIFYDEIIIQDGRYIYRGGETGNFEIFLPAGQYDGDRTILSACETGKEFGVKIGDQKIIWGTAESAYETDFYPITNKGGIVQKDYIRWLPIDLPEKDKKVAKEMASLDLKNDELDQFLPSIYYQRKNILESLYFDAFLAFHLKASFITDERMIPIMHWKNQKIGIKFDCAIESVFQHSWVSIGLRDFGDLPWDEVIRLRESKAGKDLRRLLGQISAEIKEFNQSIKDPKEIELLIHRLLSQELIRQLCIKRTKPRDVFLNLGLNLIPYGGGIAVSGIMDIKRLIEQRNSWVNLIEIKQNS